MAIIKKGYYTPGHKPEPSLHEKLKGLRMTTYSANNRYAIPVVDDSRPLPFVKGSCFANAEEKAIAHKEWHRTYHKAGA